MATGNQNINDQLFRTRSRNAAAENRETPEEIRARIGEADAVYIRVDQNKAYWVKGDENGDIDLW